MSAHYHIKLFWSDSDDCWVADVPDLKRCSAFGSTPEEATVEIGIAMAAWLEVAKEQGDPIPLPRYRPAIYALHDRNAA